MELPKFENFVKTFGDVRKARIEYITHLRVLSSRINDEDVRKKIEQRIQYHLKKLEE